MIEASGKFLRGCQMLAKFSVRGFKNFREKLTFDLTNTGKYAFNESEIRNGIINKGIIYGVNGAGKSNLGEAIFDIEKNTVFSTMTLGSQNPPTPLTSGNYRTVGYTGPIEFEYEFRFDNDIVRYKYEKESEYEIISEDLVVNGKTILKYRQGTEVKTDIPEANGFDFSRMPKGKSAVFYMFTFIRFSRDSLLNRMLDFVKGMLWFNCLRGRNETSGYMLPNDLIEDAIVKAGKVKDFQKFLEKAGLQYKLSSRSRLYLLPNNLQKEAQIIVAEMNGEQVPLAPLLSTGTKALELFFYWSMEFSEVTFLFIDEFDAFYHFELSTTIVQLLNKYTQFQSFVTTHNTSLMTNKLMRPDNIFIIENNKITPLCDRDYGELREGHNLEKIYRNGGF